MSPYNLRSRREVAVAVIVSKEGKEGAKNSKAVPPKDKGKGNRVRAPKTKTAATVVPGPEVQVRVEVEEQQNSTKTRQRRIVKQNKGEDDVQANKKAKISDLKEEKPLRRGLAREAKTNPRNCKTKPVSIKPAKASPKIDKIKRKNQLHKNKCNGDMQETADSETIISTVKTTPNKAKEKKQRAPKCGKNNLKTGGKDKPVHEQHTILNSHDVHKVTSGDPADPINVSRSKLRRKSVHKISKSSTTVRNRARKSLSLLITPRNSIKIKQVAVGVGRRISKCKVIAPPPQPRSHFINGVTHILRPNGLGSFKIRDSLSLYGFLPDRSNVAKSDDGTDSTDDEASEIEMEVTALAPPKETLELESSMECESAFTTALSSSSMFANRSSYDITAYEDFDHLKQDGDYRGKKRIPGWAKDDGELNLSLYVQNCVLESMSCSPFPPNRPTKMF